MGSLKVALSSLLKFCTVKRIKPSGLAVSSSITTSCGSLGEESPFGTVESPPASNKKKQIKRVCKDIWKSYCTLASSMCTNQTTVAVKARHKPPLYDIPSFVSISSWSLSFSVAFILSSSSLQFEILGRLLKERVPATTLMCLLAMRPIAPQNPAPGNTAMSPYCIESLRFRRRSEGSLNVNEIKSTWNPLGQTLFVHHCDISQGASHWSVGIAPAQFSKAVVSVPTILGDKFARMQIIRSHTTQQSLSAHEAQNDNNLVQIFYYYFLLMLSSFSRVQEYCSRTV